ncbi:hypothetical protein F5050DRAFT_1812312 [Lentinula boryana]|uniref:Uncharacterized protein n=1 Tax=Lentinula boryana TaxID=40481 RepID=A0ABQ8PYX1_9AGAR|nr:hypothetical protein F5050DRAFT_1812312 [Lentinula boryana]
MSIVLPPLPDPSTPSLPMSRINKQAQVHLFNNNPMPPFPIPLRKLELSKSLNSIQRYNLKRGGMVQVMEIVCSAMSWGEDLYWHISFQLATSESIVIKHGFNIWLQHHLWHQNMMTWTMINLNKGILFCLTHFGHIYNRWQPNKDCDDPEEAAWRSNHLIFDNYLQAPASANIQPSQKCKQKRKDKKLADELSQNKHPTIRHRVTRQTSMSPLQEWPFGSVGFCVSGWAQLLHLDNSSVVAIRKVKSTKKHALKEKFKQAVIEIVRARTC